VAIDADKLAVNPLVVAQTMQDGAVLVEMATGDCFELNRVGAEMWSRLAGGASVGEIVTAIAERYDVAASKVDADFRVLVAELTRRGLVTSPR
jgi:hypothetical protein